MVIQKKNCSNESCPKILRAFRPMSTSSGLIAIVGKPNVGKSTLLNYILGRKVSITSRKSQTTRNNITGIKTLEKHQMVFIDTPGIHTTSKKTLNKILNRSFV